MSAVDKPVGVILSFEGNARAFLPTICLTVLAALQTLPLAILEQRGVAIPTWLGMAAFTLVLATSIGTFCFSKVRARRLDDFRDSGAYKGSFLEYIDRRGQGECQLDPRWMGGFVGGVVALLGIPAGIFLPVVTAPLGFWLTHFYLRAKWRRGIE